MKVFPICGLKHYLSGFGNIKIKGPLILIVNQQVMIQAFSRIFCILIFRLYLSYRRKTETKKENKMKKLILSVTAVCAFVLSSNAQTEKGTFILGGSASYQSSKSDADNAKASENLSLVPNVGYFVSDNIAIGTGIGYQYNKVGSASPIGQNEVVVVSPFGRYYVGLSDNFKFFGQASVPMAFGTVKATDVNGKSGDKVGTSTSVGVALSPGFAYFPTKKIGIEFALNGASFDSYTVKDANDDKIEGAGSEEFSIGTNFFAPRIGIQFHF